MMQVSGGGGRQASPAASPIEFGLGSYNLNSPYFLPRSYARLIEETVEEIRLAEELGFGSVWGGEHHHAYDGFNPSPLPLMAHIATRTSRIMLGVGVLLLPLQGARRVAHACAAIQSIAPGRLRVAAGVGYWKDEFTAVGLSLKDRGRITDEVIESLLRGPERELFGRTELFAGGAAPPALRRAARNGASLLLPAPTVEAMREAREIWSANLEVAPGRARPRVFGYWDCWVDRNPRRLPWVKGVLRESWKNYAVNWADNPDQLPFAELDSKSAARSREALRAQRQAMADEAINKVTLLGGPSRFVDFFAPYVEAGIDGIVFRLRFPGVETRELREAMTVLASDVIPQLGRLRQ